MPSSISDRLKALGVSVGARDLKPSLPTRPKELEETLGGRLIETPLGEAFVVETRYPVGQPHGEAALEIKNSLEALAEWAGDERLHSVEAQEILFLDTETTGLSGGTGTYAFLIGTGRFIGEDFVLQQYFLRDPADEIAQLAALEAFMAPCRAMVTFNGKAFDSPLLITRFTIQGLKPPLLELAHIDLLHLARRLWRDRLPSRSLPNLEVQILGALRSEQDIPGWLIPQIYFDYLRDRDPVPLKNVFYHNAMDVVSLAALLDHMAGLLDDPLGKGNRFGIDLISLAKLFEDLGHLERATLLYIHGLEHEDAQNDRMPRFVLLQALQRLAQIYKRRNDLQAAIRLWQQAAQYHQLEAHIELAKCYEHQLKDIQQAIFWTESAASLIEGSNTQSGTSPQAGAYQNRIWADEVQHRLERLQRKLASVG
jgi:uncharacterized protein YprB with RNaseH-like and TPR domain